MQVLSLEELQSFMRTGAPPLRLRQPSSPLSRCALLCWLRHRGGALSPRVRSAVFCLSLPLFGLFAGCPDGVDNGHKEAYLSDADFERALGCPREQFKALPSWQQRQRKKKAKLDKSF